MQILSRKGRVVRESIITCPVMDILAYVRCSCVYVVSYWIAYLTPIRWQICNCGRSYHLLCYQHPAKVLVMVCSTLHAALRCLFQTIAKTPQGGAGSC